MMANNRRQECHVHTFPQTTTLRTVTCTHLVFVTRLIVYELLPHAYLAPDDFYRLEREGLFRVIPRLVSLVGVETDQRALVVERDVPRR